MPLRSPPPAEAVVREVRHEGGVLRLDLRPQMLSVEADEPLAQTPPADSSGFVSAATLLFKAKQVDDGLLAAVELAAQRGAGRLTATDLLARRHEVESRGGRVGEWKFCFHGFECCFTHRRTGQVVDVRLGFGEEFGVLDPYFLAHFIRTSAAHREAATLLADDYHDPSRMLEVLHAGGHLRVITMANEQLGGMMMRGLVLDTSTGEVAQRPVEGHSPVGDRGRAGVAKGETVGGEKRRGVSIPVFTARSRSP